MKDTIKEKQPLIKEIGFKQKLVKKEVDVSGYEALFLLTMGILTRINARTIEINIPRRSKWFGESLGLQIDHTDEIIQYLKKGLPFLSFEHLGREIDISDTYLANLTNITSRTLARRKQEGRLRLDESERLFRLSSLYERASEVLGSTVSARNWLKTAKKALGGKTPLEYADTEIGAREVEELLGRLEHGVFS